jgi:hypothetical protein
MQGEQTVSCRKEFATGSDPGQRNAVVLEEWSSQIIMMLQPFEANPYRLPPAVMDNIPG